MKESIVLKPYKKKIILFDTASIVDRNGSTVNILQPKIDNLEKLEAQKEPKRL